MGCGRAGAGRRAAPPTCQRTAKQLELFDDFQESQVPEWDPEDENQAAPGDGWPEVRDLFRSQRLISRSCRRREFLSIWYADDLRQGYFPVTPAERGGLETVLGVRKTIT